MKAIYINLDPYLAAFAAWVAGGKSGPAPFFDPIPLAVTVPLGQSLGIYCPGNSGDPAAFVVGDVTMTAVGHGQWNPGGGGNIAAGLTPGFSAFPGTEEFPQKYAVKAVESDDFVYSVDYGDYDTGSDRTISFRILVRREQASGPVDLVDFTPPVDTTALDFTGADIKGAEFDGNEIEAAAGTGVLSAPAAGG